MMDSHLGTHTKKVRIKRCLCICHPSAPEACDCEMMGLWIRFHVSVLRFLWDWTELILSVRVQDMDMDMLNPF